MRFFSDAWRILLDAFFPPRCPLCDRFVPVPHSPCDGCAGSLRPLEGDASLAFDPPRLSRCRSRFAYEGPVREALHRFKYHERLDLRRFLCGELSAEARAMEKPDLIIPVPLHRGRLRVRGFNQSALLAGGVGRGMQIPVDLDSLCRTRDIEPQVGLCREARLENVKGAFAVRDARRGRIEGRRVLIIDDVLTTGATAHECARALCAAGAESVCALTVARAL